MQVCMAEGEILVQRLQPLFYYLIHLYYGKKRNYRKVEKVFYAAGTCMPTHIQEVFGIADMELFRDRSTGNPTYIEGGNHL